MLILYSIFDHFFDFSLIFKVILSKKTRLLQSIDQWWMRGGNITKIRFWDLRWAKRQFLAMSDIYLFYFFSQNIKFIYSAWYWPKSVQFGQPAQFGDGLDIYEWGWVEIKIQLCPNLGEGVLRGKKPKICPFLIKW